MVLSQRSLRLSSLLSLLFGFSGSRFCLPAHCSTSLRQLACCWSLLVASENVQLLRCSSVFGASLALLRNPCLSLFAPSPPEFFAPLCDHHLAFSRVGCLFPLHFAPRGLHPLSVGKWGVARFVSAFVLAELGLWRQAWAPPAVPHGLSCPARFRPCTGSRTLTH